MLTAKIAVSAVPYAIDQPYTYTVPAALAAGLSPGMRVLVPFGQSDRLSEGLVLSLEEQEVEDNQCKPVADQLDEKPVLRQEDLQLAFWMRARFFCTVYEAAMTMLPPGLWYVLKERWSIAGGFDRETSYEAVAPSKKKRLLLDVIWANGGTVELTQLKGLSDLPDPKRTLRALEKQGLLRRETIAKRKTVDKTEKLAVLALPPEEALSLAAKAKARAPMGYRVTELLCSLGSSSMKELTYFTGASAQTVQSLQRKGILTFREREVFRRELPQPESLRPLLPLNGQQQTVYEGLSALLEPDTPQAALLYGVTGSGKTQVYLHLIKQVLSQGRGAIVLVPEIALTPSLLQTFLSHFGRQVAVLHSCLPAGERYDEWKRVREGLAPVVIGTRSAVFAPLPNVGLIILDEEQEGSYQSEGMVRYHARDVAKYRCAQHKALLLLGSATPGIDSRYTAEQGRYHLFTLRQRYNRQAMPRVQITDMRQTLRQGETGYLSALLRQELEENFRRGEQSILFLNRRGNSRMALCQSCGQSPSCPRCTVHLTYHSVNGRLMCHHCGYSAPLPEHCPQCGGRLHFVGAGTQKLQLALEALYPDQEVLRMDADTISAAHSHEAMLKRFRQKRIPILLGTQMVTKGLDFPNVTLVGIIDADLSLYADSYRASERTFSLLTQVVGRAGRGDKPGRAVLQTWTPDNPVITLAAHQDYDSFYQQELALRQSLRLPPFLDLFRITVIGAEEGAVLQLCTLLRYSLTPWIREKLAAGEEMQLLGPAPAGILKINNRYRYCLLLKGKNDPETRQVLARLLQNAQRDPANRKLALFVDMNPTD